MRGRQQLNWRRFTRSILTEIISWCIVLAIFAALALLSSALVGCATNMVLIADGQRCTLTGEINTGTTVTCENGKLTVSRTSVSATTDGLAKAAAMGAVEGLK